MFEYAGGEKAVSSAKPSRVYEQRGNQSWKKMSLYVSKFDVNKLDLVARLCWPKGEMVDGTEFTLLVQYDCCQVSWRTVYELKSSHLHSKFELESLRWSQFKSFPNNVALM